MVVFGRFFLGCRYLSSATINCGQQQVIVDKDKQGKKMREGGKKMILTEIASGETVEGIRAQTTANFEVAENLKTIG